MKNMIVNRVMMLLGCVLLVAGSYYHIQSSNALEEMDFEIKFQAQIMGEGLFRGNYEPDRAISLIEKAKFLRKQRNYSLWGIFAGAGIVLIGFVYSFGSRMNRKPGYVSGTDTSVSE
jgi:hypothetical protein